MSESTVTRQELRRFIVDALAAVGVAPLVADRVAEGLVFADLRGVGTHGVVRLPVYIRRIEEGLVNPKPSPVLSRTAPATAVLDGDNGPGIAVGCAAMDHAVQIAGESGAGVVSVRGGNHFGAAGFPARRAARAGMIGIALSHSEADVVPYGGARAALGTNPLAVAVPARDRPELILDMATSMVAMGRIMLAAQEDRDIPPGWAVDAEGAPTTDPKTARAVLPLGGPKGYGLAVMVDALSGALSGGPYGAHVPRMYDDFSRPQGLGHLVMAMDPERFVGRERFLDIVDAMAGELRAVPPAPGFTEVRLPGEPEHRLAEERSRSGIPLSAATSDTLAELAERLGVRALHG